MGTIFPTPSIRVTWTLVTLWSGTEPRWPLGDVWEIESIEKWTAEGDVQVIAPAGQSGNVGDTFDYSFSVQNLQSSSDTFDLSTSSSQGWTVSLPGGSTVTIAAGSSETVLVQVTATSAGTDLTTLTATSQTDPNVTNNDSVTTQALGSPAPIPTLNEWGMIIFSLLMAGSAFWFIRKRGRNTC